MKKVALFGGSFNPPHLGHLNVARVALEQLDLDHVYIVPVALPHKDVNILAAPQSRLEMTRELFSALEGTSVESWEIDRGAPSYTFDTALHLRDIEPEAQIFLLVGDDLASTLPSWHRSSELTSLCTVAFFPRYPERADLSHLSFPFEQISSSVFECDSTSIRREILAHQSPEGLSEQTLRYIYDHKIYLGEKGDERF